MRLYVCVCACVLFTSLPVSLFSVLVLRVCAPLRSSVREALLIPGAVLLLSFLLLLLLVGVRLSGHVSTAAAAIPVTLFAGGTGALALYNTGWTWENFMK